jgi:hypothetical protein
LANGWNFRNRIALGVQHPMLLDPKSNVNERSGYFVQGELFVASVRFYVRGIRRDQQSTALSEHPSGLRKDGLQLKMPDGFQKHHEIEAAGSEG